jgi:hypothetical protein
MQFEALLEAGDGEALEEAIARPAAPARSGAWADPMFSTAFLDLPPLEPPGHRRLPGSKSISNRVLLLAALSRARPPSTTCSTPTTRA